MATEYDNDCTYRVRIGQSEVEKFKGKARPLSEVIEFYDNLPKPITGDRWGRWRYVRRGNLLCIGGIYNVQLNTIRGTRELAGYLLELCGKPWATTEDIGNFVKAISDIVCLFKLMHKKEGR
jgi:hypothetical protein